MVRSGLLGFDRFVSDVFDYYLILWVLMKDLREYCSLSDANQTRIESGNGYRQTPGAFVVLSLIASRAPLQPIGGKYLALCRENWDDSLRLADSEACDCIIFLCSLNALLLRQTSGVRPFGLPFWCRFLLMLPSQLELSRG